MNQTNKDTYEEIAERFSETRAYVWQCVKDFTNLITDNSNILEIGCGNGKNMEYILKNINVNLIGIDTCKKFVSMCQEKKLNVILGDALKLHFEDNIFDYVLCIAMFHHLLTEEEQDISFKEMLRVMKTGAIGILTCWATEQPIESKFEFTKGVNIVPWKGKDNTKTRYYYVYNEEMFLHFFMKYEEITIIKIYNEVGNWILLFKKKFIT
jgi:ubiquinone/menaquinone biosynthesis C-methylase UbiE